jgi:hypothetical protein
LRLAHLPVELLALSFQLGVLLLKVAQPCSAEKI